VLQFKYNDPCYIVDIPGLISGASDGVGLGLTFLRHIERTSILLFIIDAASQDVAEDFRILENELRLYKEELLHRDHFLVFNKIDKVSAGDLHKIDEYFSGTSRKFVHISCLTGEGITELKDLLETTIEGYRKKTSEMHLVGKMEVENL
jgi:GTPase